MKKSLKILTAILMSALLLTGCGADENSEGSAAGESSAAAGDSSAEAGDSESAVGDSAIRLKDLGVEQYVTLGEYKGLEVAVAAPSVEDAEWEQRTWQVYTGSFPAERGITDRAVAEGDTANIDYEGKKDGVAFDGGTASGYNLVIGSGSFIDGFEEGLVGVLPGETVDLNLTFPEGYGNADLAGQEVVFTVTVNYIIPSEIDDSVVADLGIEGVTTGEELRQSVYDYLYAAAEQKYQTNVENGVMTKLIANCTFGEIPAELMTQYEETARTNIEAAAATYGMDADTFTYYNYYMDLESFLNIYVESSVKQSLAVQAIANAENLNISDEELEQILTEGAQAAGVASAEEYLGAIDREEYREYCMFEKVLDFLIENAVVSQ